MKIPEKIPVRAIAGIIVITVCIIILAIIVFSLPVYSPPYLKDPDTICLPKPAVDEKTMDSLWDAIVNRTGLDPGSAEFGFSSISISPDGTLGMMGLEFYATANGEYRHYTALQHFVPEACVSNLNIVSEPAARSGFPPRTSRSPLEILAEFTRVGISRLPLNGDQVGIGTWIIPRGTDAVFNATTCTELYLLKNETLVRAGQIHIHTTYTDIIQWGITPQRCADIPGYGRECTFPEKLKGITILIDPQVTGDEFTITVPGGSLAPDAPACPYGQNLGMSIEKSLNREKYMAYTENPDGSVAGKICTKTFLGETCTNWTV
jgi:hypothetical protein